MGATKDIFERLLANEEIPMNDPDYGQVRETVEQVMGLNINLNNSKSLAEARKYLGEIIGTPVDETTTVYPPFYTNYGKNISLGKGVFINHDCSMLDLGGIEIEDEVMIGPRVSITSENHPISPKERKTLVPGKVTIKENAWIGSNVNILPGVTIGEYSVVAAGAVVSKDVPPRTLVGGIPAKKLKKLED